MLAGAPLDDIISHDSYVCELPLPKCHHVVLGVTPCPVRQLFEGWLKLHFLWNNKF